MKIKKKAFLQKTMPLPERVKVEIKYTIFIKEEHTYKISFTVPIPDFVTVREIRNGSIEEFDYYLSGPNITPDHEIYKDIECISFTDVEEDVKVVCEKEGDEFEDLMKDHDWRGDLYFEASPVLGW